MTADRLQDALRRVNTALNPQQAYALVWEYRVLVAQPGPPVKIDCEAVDPDTQAILPKQLVGIILWPGPSGCIAVPQPGTLVRIGFANGDPAKPMVVGLDPSSQPILVMLDGSPGPFIARVGDAIQWLVSPALAAAITAPPSGGPCSVTPGPPVTISGTITSGSLKVQSP